MAGISLILHTHTQGVDWPFGGCDLHLKAKIA